MASHRLVKQRQMTIFVTSRIWYSNHFHDGKSKFFAIRLGHQHPQPQPLL